MSQIRVLTVDNGPVTDVSRREFERDLGECQRENVNVNWVKSNVIPVQAKLSPVC